MENSWQEFIKDLQKSVNAKISNLNKHREYIMKDNQLRKRLILQEIKLNNYESPYKVIDEKYNDIYIRENYDTNLLIKELKTIENIFNTNKSFPELMDKKEALEVKKNIITQYLNFLVSKHFQQILSSLIKLNTTEDTINNSIIRINGLKNNLTLLKKNYLLASLKIVKSKQKYDNLCKLKIFLSNVMGQWRWNFQEAKKIKKQGGGYVLFKKYTMLQNDIVKWKNKNEILFKNKKQNFFLPDLILQKLKKKMENIKNYFDNTMSSIFTCDDNNNDLGNIYNLFCTIKVLSSQDPLEAFKIALKKSMRDSIFFISKDIISKSVNNIYNINVQNIHKFSVFKLYSLKEEEYFNFIYILLNKLIIIAEHYNKYLEKEKDNNIGKLLLDSSKEFYELFEKKITKIITLLSPPLATSNEVINKIQSFVRYISSINLFTETLQYYFNCKGSKYIKPYIIDLVKNQFNFHIKFFIKKICIYLGSDIWKRIPYEEKINPIFTGGAQKSKQKNANFIKNYQKFMIFFNKEAENFIANINELTNGIYDNLPEFFNRFINEHQEVLANLNYNDNNIQSSINLRTVLNLNENLNIEKESKLDEDSDMLISSKDILSGAALTSIRFISDFIGNIFIYSSLDDYIFEKILIIFEYYFVGSLNILMFNKSYFEQIFRLVDLTNMKKPNGLITTSQFALFLENHIELKKFLLKAVSDLSKLYDGTKVNLFEDTNKLNSSNINELLEQNRVIFPKLNPSMPLDITNKYCLLIETLVLVESVYSIYKYIKRNYKLYFEKKEKENKANYTEVFSLYKKALKQLASYLYSPICINILIIDPILKKIELKKWDIDEKPQKNDMIFVTLLIEEIVEKLEKLELLSGWSLTQKSILRFFNVLIDTIINNLFDVITKIKNWSEVGRNLFFEYMNKFKSMLAIKLKEKNLEPNLDKHFERLFKFIKAWFYDEEKIIKYINEDKIEYRHVISIIFNGFEFKKLSNKDKEQIIKKIEDIYYANITSLNEKLIQIK